jgi:hypothetical protein
VKSLEAKWRRYSERDFKKRHSTESDCDVLIDEPCMIYADGELAAVLLYEVDFPESTRQTVLGLEDWTTGVRGSGVQTTTIAIGNQPRAPARSKEACMCSKIGYYSPAAHKEILALTEQAEKFYAQHCPDWYASHKQHSEKDILPEWRINNGVYTSGVMNKNCSMAYHRDRNNITDGWSAMYVLKKNMSGANLNVIDLNAKLYLPDRSLLLFNGQKYMHGVTPMRKNKPDGYRYSIVFYTLAAMKQCLTAKEEIKRAQAKRTEREYRRAGLIE